jgi:hypothetical protein
MDGIYYLKENTMIIKEAPFKSKAQQKFMFAAEARGDIKKGTAKRWAEHTPDIKDLPEKIEKKANEDTSFAERFKKSPGDSDQALTGNVMSFMSNNKGPEDEQVHNLAANLGAPKDKVEEEAYKLLSDFLAFGKANSMGITEADVDPEQLRRGIEVEMEHTNNQEIAKRIALDHLAEFPHYYFAIDKMEEALKQSDTPVTTEVPRD